MTVCFMMRGRTGVGLVRSRLVTVLRRQIIAAVGDPVGRKANWSVNDRFGTGERKAG